MSFSGRVSGGNRRPNRRSRAQWWFERMRKVVALAGDWRAAPPARPEQIWFPGAHRHVVLTATESAPASEERQICE